MKQQETALYPPIRSWLEHNGYTVRAEVRDCDVAATRNDELVLIEMKRAVNLDLLIQISRRQRTHASVYAAVPAPPRRDKRWRELSALLRRLEAGLLLVHVDSALPRIEVAFHPMAYRPARRTSLTRAVLTEMAGRSMDLNAGGSCRRKIVTAYREQALHVAAALQRLGEAPPRALRAAGTPAKTGSILRDNHYGWFQRLRPGIYSLTGAGESALVEYAELCARLRLRLDEAAGANAAG